MAPELIMGNNKKNQSTDVYAFGLTIIEVKVSPSHVLDTCHSIGTIQIWTGKCPFYGISNQIEIIMAISRGERPGRPEGMPDWVWELASRCWERDVEKRPHMDEVEREVLLLCLEFRFYPSYVFCQLSMHCSDGSGKDMKETPEHQLYTSLVPTRSTRFECCCPPAVSELSSTHSNSTTSGVLATNHHVIATGLFRIIIHNQS